LVSITSPGSRGGVRSVAAPRDAGISEEEAPMRHFLGMMAAGALWLAFTTGAAAQDSINAFGGFPTQTGAGVPYTLYAPRTNEGTTDAYLRYPYSNFGSTAVAPGLTTYNAGYSGVVPGTYLPTRSYPAYGYSTYSYPTYGGYTTYSYPSYGYTTYRYRRGLFGPRRW
jgi:hypothetical protein